MTVIVGNFQPGSVLRESVQLIRRSRAYVAQWVMASTGLSPAAAKGSGVSCTAIKLVAFALSAAYGRRGCHPTKAWIAGHTGLCERVVARVLNFLRRAGFLNWHRCKAFIAGVWRQTSNAYDLLIPDQEPDRVIDDVEPAEPPALSPEPSPDDPAPLVGESVYEERITFPRVNRWSDSAPPEVESALSSRSGVVVRALRFLHPNAHRQAQGALDAREAEIKRRLLADYLRRARSRLPNSGGNHGNG